MRLIELENEVGLSNLKKSTATNNDGGDNPGGDDKTMNDPNRRSWKEMLVV